MIGESPGIVHFGTYREDISRGFHEQRDKREDPWANFEASRLPAREAACIAGQAPAAFSGGGLGRRFSGRGRRIAAVVRSSDRLRARCLERRVLLGLLSPCPCSLDTCCDVGEWRRRCCRRTNENQRARRFSCPQVLDIEGPIGTNLVELPGVLSPEDWDPKRYTLVVETVPFSCGIEGSGVVCVCCIVHVQSRCDPAWSITRAIAAMIVFLSRTFPPYSRRKHGYFSHVFLRLHRFSVYVFSL